MRKKAHGNHTTSTSSPSKIPTKQNNKKNKDKKKRQSTRDIDVDSKLAQTPPEQCSQLLITNPKPDDLATIEPVPKISGTYHSELGFDRDKMYKNLTLSGSRETVSVNNIESLSEPNNVSQLEADIGSSDTCLTKLLNPGFSGLFGSDFYKYEENEISRTSPSSSNDKSVMEMWEEFWNVENIMIEANLGCPTDPHFASTSDCNIGDWLL